MPAARIATFDDWVDLFRVWRNDIGVNYPEIENYQFEAKFGPTRSNEIEFGAFKGRPKWQRVLQIPDQRMRDGLLNLIVYQGDTEFASVEQQRRLFETFAKRARPQVALPRGHRRNAPRLADVPPADQPLWLQRQRGSAENARAPCLRIRSACSARSIRSSTTGSTFSSTPISSIAMENSS